MGFIGFFSTNLYIYKVKKKDPSEVVIDEFSGQLIATSTAGISPITNILAFLLFRYFDIFKPLFIKNCEEFKGALGIMLDDWVAGILASMFTFLILYYYKFPINFYFF